MNNSSEKTASSSSVKVLVSVLLLLILAVSFFTAWKFLSPQPSSGSKSITVNVLHLSGEEKSFSFSTDAEYLRAALEAESLISGTESTYGLWVDTVDGEKADDSLLQWWGFNVNGELAMNGVDTQPVSDGDVYDFILNVGY